MTDRTISIYCIGTAHRVGEEYNILRMLYDLTDANSGWMVERTPGKWTDSNLFRPHDKVPNPDDEHHKVLYDGPPNFPDLGARAAGQYMVNVTNNAKLLINSIKLSVNEKLKVNLVGHSRGAVNCLMIAAALRTNSRVSCNLFLIDAVKVTGRNDLTRATIPEAETRLYANVADCLHIVMEDDVKFVLGPLKFGIFRLYKFAKDDKSPPKIDVEHIRFPGTHGTATQCNEMVKDGEQILKLPKDRLIPEADKMWPIGGAVLSLALQKLRSWGTPLHDEGRKLANEKQEFSFLTRIQRSNPFLTPYSKKRLINDSKNSRPGEIQEVELVPGGPDKVTYRSEKTLNNFGTNPLRYHPIFVNRRHVDLAVKFLGSDLVAMILLVPDGKLILDETDKVLVTKTLGLPVSRNLHDQAAGTGEDFVNRILRTIQRNVNRFPDFFTLLTAKGFTWQRRPLDFKLEQGGAG